MSIKNLLGMRTLKTGIAVVISMYLGYLGLVINPFYAVLSTILAMQNTVKTSFAAGKNRIFGTMLGAVIGFLFATLSSYLGGISNPLFILLANALHPLYVGIAIIGTIMCCHLLKLNPSIPIALTVCFSIIMGDADRNLIVYSLLRTSDTSVGIIVSLLVNYFIAQPNYLGSLTDEIEKIEFMAFDSVKNILLNRDLNLKPLNEELTRLNAIYQNYAADTKYDKNPVSTKRLTATIEACHDIYFHVKSIDKLPLEATELSPENRTAIIEFFSHGCVENVILKDPVEPIFEYHIHQMLNELRLLTTTVEDLTEHLEEVNS